MQVVILHKEIACKIAETVHCAKYRSPRAAGSRRRAAHKKDPSDVQGAKVLIVFHPGADIRGIATIVPLFHFFHHLFPGDQVTEGLVYVINLSHLCYLLFFYLSVL